MAGYLANARRGDCGCAENSNRRRLLFCCAGGLVLAGVSFPHGRAGKCLPVSLGRVRSSGWPGGRWGALGSSLRFAGPGPPGPVSSAPPTPFLGGCYNQAFPVQAVGPLGVVGQLSLCVPRSRPRPRQVGKSAGRGRSGSLRGSDPWWNP